MKQIQLLLTQHGVETKIENGQLMAFDVVYNPDTKEDFSTWINASSWSVRQTLNFLGY